jgi:hypothetical protein
MAHIPMDDVDMLWSESGQSWEGLVKSLENRKEKANGISENLILMMIPEAQDMEKSGQPFPDSPQKLSEVLNQNLGKYQQFGEDLDKSNQ